MRCYASLVNILLILFALSTVHDSRGESSTESSIYNDTMHMFLILVLDEDLHQLRRFRQDEETGGEVSGLTFAQTGQNLGQIIQGVLGGNLGPIFSGSVNFVGNSNVQRSVGSLLGAFTPALNLILREMYTRTQVALGFGTTPKPAVPTPANSSQFFEYETDYVLSTGNNATTSTQTANRPQQQFFINQPQRLPLAQPTTAWQYVLSQALGTTTTVEPLPFIRRPTRVSLIIDEDDNDEGDDLIFATKQF